MSALKVLTVGVSLVFALQAMESQTDNRAADASTREAIAPIAAAAQPVDVWVTQRAARVSMRQGDYSGAVRLLEKCVAGAKTPAERVVPLALYGTALLRLDRAAEARPALERALAEWAVTPETPAEERIATSGVLASVDRRLGDYRAAEHVLRSAIGEQSVSNDQQATLMVGLADLLREQGREADSGKVLNDASQLTGLSPQRETDVLIESAELARDMSHWNTSVELWNKIGEIARSEHSVQLEAIVAGGLGETWFAAGNLARSEPLIRRSLNLLRADPGTSPSQLATALSSMARLYRDEDKLVLAEQALDEAIGMDEDALGREHPQIAILLELRATIQSRRGEAQPARDDLEHARAIISAHFGPDSTPVAGVLATLGDVEQRANRPAVAVNAYALSMNMLRRHEADNLTFGSGIVARYAAALKAAHRPSEARALMRSFEASVAAASATAGGKTSDSFASAAKSLRGN